MSFIDTYNTLRDRFDSVFSEEADFQDKPPKEGDEKVPSYVGGLWEDATKYFTTAFAKSKSENTSGGKQAYTDPESFWNAIDKLENGDHFSVYGTRKGGNNNWKQEFVDNEIQDQLRARCSFITTNWHDVTITPNLKGINEILDQERKATNWRQNVHEWVKYPQRYGDVWIRSILDKTENPQGVATEITCKPGSVLITPFAKSIKKLDGCWYVIHGQQVNDKWVRDNYPKLKIDTGGEKPKFFQIDRNQKETSYKYTKMLNKLEAFFDDETLETIPFTQEEFDERIGLLMANLQVGEANPVQPTPEDNHKKYVKAYLEWLEEKVGFYKKVADETLEQGGTLLQEDLLLVNEIMDAVSRQVFMHEELIEKTKEKDSKIPVGKRKKYPLGRYVVTINGALAEDGQNPYKNDWRKLFHYLPNERVPERIDGRGDVEILWNDNFIIDTMLSRFADDGLLATHKKPWFKVSEKKQIEEAGYSTDPTTPGYYVDQPPTFPTGSVNTQYLDSYNTTKQNMKQKLGVNEVTYGQRGGDSESGKHAELLLSQNATIITGELNQNLNDVIEDIVETRISLWKEFYTEPRIYTIDGQQQEIVLAEYLRQQEVVENGQTVFKDIPGIEVSVRPNSNFPNKVETETDMLIRLRSAMPEDIPVEMILDYLAQRFPALGRNGKYRRENEFTKIGKAVVMEQQRQQQELQKQSKPLDDVKRKVQSRITTEAANQITGAGNGATSRQ